MKNADESQAGRGEGRGEVAARYQRRAALRFISFLSYFSPLRKNVTVSKIYIICWVANALQNVADGTNPPLNVPKKERWLSLVVNGYPFGRVWSGGHAGIDLGECALLSYKLENSIFYIS